MNIPLSKPWIGQEEQEAVQEVLTSGWLSMGQKTEAFEQAFAKLLGSPYAVAVSSGTAGLHLAVHALGLGPEDEVITSPFSFVASANCLLYEGVKPVFADVEEKSFNLDPANLERALSPRTKAILPVHVFGQTCDMGSIQAFADRHGLAIIEDACEAILASHQNKFAGTFGQAGVFGFYPNKQLTTGEGGMIITDDEELYRQFRSLRNQGRSEDGQWLHHERLGFNYRIHELTAALGLAQCGRLTEMIAMRSQVASWYNASLSELEFVRLPVVKAGNVHSWFVYGVRVAAEIRDPLINWLIDHGVQSKAYFSPCIHLQPFYQKQFGFRDGDFPVAEALSREMLILPFYPQMSIREVAYVSEQLEAGIRAIRKEIG